MSFRKDEPLEERVNRQEVRDSNAAAEAERQAEADRLREENAGQPGYDIEGNLQTTDQLPDEYPDEPTPETNLGDFQEQGGYLDEDPEDEKTIAGHIGSIFSTIGKTTRWIDDQLIPQRGKFIDWLEEKNMMAAIAADFILPDSIDIATFKAAGGTYIPRRILSKGPEAIRAYARLWNKTQGKSQLLLQKAFERLPAQTVYALDPKTADNLRKASEAVSGTARRHGWTDIKKGKNILNRELKNKRIGPIQELLTKLDDFRLNNVGAEYPLQGFAKWFGKRPTFTGVNGVEYGIGWSRKNQAYEVYNFSQRLKSRAKYLAESAASNPEKAEKASILFALKRDLNKTSRVWNPVTKSYDIQPVDLWDVIIQNPGSAYVEHLISVNSPFWKSPLGKKIGYKAGDPENLKIIGDRNFKLLKDNIEKHIHKIYNGQFFVDYDKATQNLIIRNTLTGFELPTQIPGYGRAIDFRTYIQDVFQNKPMKSLAEVNPDIPPNILRQMQKEGYK